MAVGGMMNGKEGSRIPRIMNVYVNNSVVIYDYDNEASYFNTRKH